MSDLGVGLLLFACLLVAVGLIRFFSWLTELQEEHGSIRRAGVNTIRRYVSTSPRVMSRENAATATNASAEPAQRRSGDFPLLNGEEPQNEPFANPPELVLNASEIAAVVRMIDHNRIAVKPSKSSTIQAGFAVSRGGSAAYARASLIYDALFGPPPPAVHYRARTPEQEALRKQLKLN